jgi:hypothetical protein
MSVDSNPGTVTMQAVEVNFDDLDPFEMLYHPR